MMGDPKMTHTKFGADWLRCLGYRVKEGFKNRANVFPGPVTCSKKGTTVKTEQKDVLRAQLVHAYPATKRIEH